MIELSQAAIELSQVWRPVCLRGEVFPDYEVSLAREVRRCTKNNATYAGKIVGYSKNGKPYSNLGLRCRGRTVFASRQEIVRETFPELYA